MFYGIQYTKALQEILNTEGGRLARQMIRISTPALAGKIELFSQRKGKWSKSSLVPQDAAVASIALFGMALARHGQTPDERLAGSTLQMALIDYAEKNPSAKTACVAALAKWVEVRPHAHQPVAPSPAAKPIPQMDVSIEERAPQNSTAAAAADIENACFQMMMEAGARFMTMQVDWLKMMPGSPEFDGPTAAAFAYGIWDSVAQQANWNDEDLLISLTTFVSQWMDTPDQKTIDETINAMLLFGDDPNHEESVITGGRAFRAWLAGPKGDFFPVHLGQCMTVAPRKAQAR